MKRSRSRILLFRAGAVLVGLTPFLILELALRLGGWCEPPSPVTPLAGFHRPEPLFVSGGPGGRERVISPAMRRFFEPQSFPVPKPPGEYRIFCLGGSTVQGRPFSTPTAFPRWLELELEAASPGRAFRVINVGGISYASYRLVGVLEEVLEYEPDRILLYTGHNEFLEDRTYGRIRDLGPATVKAHTLLSNFRIYHLVRRLLRSESGEDLTRSRATDPSASGEGLSGRVRARLDRPGGLDLYTRDDDWRRGVELHFEQALRGMIELCRQANVPLLVIQPASNLRDCPPFKARGSEELAPRERERFRALLEEARASYRDDLPGSIERLREAVKIDPRHAGAHYELARCLDSRGRAREARGHYIRARDEDLCPLRMPGSLERRLERLLVEEGVPRLDAREILRSGEEEALPGNDWFVDHVHPSIRGHRELARALLEKLVEPGSVEVEPGRDGRREERIRDHLARLDPLYYERARGRLEGLRAWASGRVEPVEDLEVPPSQADPAIPAGAGLRVEKAPGAR